MADFKFKDVRPDEFDSDGPDFLSFRDVL